MSASEDPCFSPVLELPRRRLFGFAVARLGDGTACLTAALQCASTWGGRDQPVVLLDSSGRSYALAAHALPSARGQGEPLTGLADSASEGTVTARQLAARPRPTLPRTWR